MLIRVAAPISLVCVLACSETIAPDTRSDGCIPPAPPQGLVTLDPDGRFQVSGEIFVPRGVGSYPLLEHAGSGRMAEVDEILELAASLGRPLVRTNAFFDGAGDNPARIRGGDGLLREEGLVGLDRLLAAADRHGVRLVLLLTNNWSDYGGAPAVLRMVAEGENLPKDAFWTDMRALDAQQQYLRALLARTNTVSGVPYGQDPTVFAWELANEPRCTTAEYCDSKTLVEWARKMSEVIRSAGATQLVSWGGAGYLGKYGEDLEAIARDGAVDVLTHHVYPSATHALHLGDGVADRPLLAARLGAASIENRARLARRHRKGLLIEELGWRPETGGGRDGERALVMGAWLRAANDQAVGALPWMVAERGRPDYDGFLIRPDRDPATEWVLRCK